MSKVTDTDNSPVSETELNAPIAGGEVVTLDANSAASSSADTSDAKQEEPKSLLDVVKRVVEPVAEVLEVPSASVEKSETDLNPKPAEGEGVADPVNDADLPFHNHPRFKEIIQERNELRPDAEKFRSMQSFMQANNLTGEEVAEGYDIMALLKSNEHGNLQKARTWFAERLQGLDSVLGNTLPDDLRQKVDDGLVDEEVARELAQQRSRADLLSHQSRQRQASEDADRQTEQEARAMQDARDMGLAVQDWENGIKAKDPDYSEKKAGMVEDQVRAIIMKRGGKHPTTQQEALDLVKEAYGNVNDTIKSITPKPRPMTPSPAGMSVRATTAPATLQDAVRAGLNR